METEQKLSLHIVLDYITMHRKLPSDSLISLRCSTHNQRSDIENYQCQVTVCSASPEHYTQPAYLPVVAVALVLVPVRVVPGVSVSGAVHRRPGVLLALLVQLPGARHIHRLTHWSGIARDGFTTRPDGASLFQCCSMVQCPKFVDLGGK